MIASLEGIIKFKSGKFIVLEVGGVGYRVFVSFETLGSLPKIGEKIRLWTHLHVREDNLSLYGFLDYAELEFFEKLIQISGIGPKSALGVLSVAPLDAIKKAIAQGESSYLVKVSGIGRKLAEKIILELKDKLSTEGSVLSGGFKQEEEALEALRALGYSLKESRDALKSVSDEIKVSGTENIIREALKNVNKKA